MAKQKPLLTKPQGEQVIAALFVDSKGCYANESFIDAWCIDRDARRYNGPNPVVAHPPCQRYGRFAKINYKRWGGEHNRPRNDGGCFASALASVNCWGGVLEHPAQSEAWELYNLVKPTHGQWSRSGIGWVCEVWQSAYGHRAQKRTWLYYVGQSAPFELRWDRIEGTHQVGFHDQRGKERNKPTLGRREASATPIEFRNELIQLAMLSRLSPAAKSTASETPDD